MSCVLRVFGSDLDIDALMLSVDLKPYDRWYKGESPDFLKAAANAGVTVELSHYPGGKEE